MNLEVSDYITKIEHVKLSNLYPIVSESQF